MQDRGMLPSTAGTPSSGGGGAPAGAHTRPATRWAAPAPDCSQAPPARSPSTDSGGARCSRSPRRPAWRRRRSTTTSAPRTRSAAALLAAELDRLTALAEPLPRGPGARGAVRRARCPSGAAPAGRSRAGDARRAARARERWADLTDTSRRQHSRWTTTARSWPVAGCWESCCSRAGRPPAHRHAGRARRRPRLTAQSSGRRRVSRTRSAAGPACPAEGAGARGEALREGEDGGVARDRSPPAPLWHRGLWRVRRTRPAGGARRRGAATPDGRRAHGQRPVGRR